MIISVLNEKGGVGKTTLSTHIAYAIKQLGHDTLLVDSDPQGSARDWHSKNDGEFLDVIGLDRLTLDKDVRRYSARYGYTIIDGAPQITEMAIKAIKCSDLVLIPVQPSPYDVWSSKSLVDLVKKYQDISDGAPYAAFVISRQIVNTRLGREVRDVLAEYELPVLENGTCQRVSYANTAGNGRTVYHTDDIQAAAEVSALVKEILSLKI